MKQERPAPSERFWFFGIIFITCLLLSNLIAGKLIRIASLSVPAAVIIFPITYIFGDIFTEVYGFQNSRRIIWMGFGCNLLAITVYQITLLLPYPEFWLDQEAFRTVLGGTPRVFLASLAGYLFGEFSNSIVISRLKVRTQGKKLWLRTISSSAVGQAFDTVLFIGIAFIGIYEAGVIWGMMLTQYLIKLCYEILLTPITYLVVNKLKKIEGNDVFDYNERYRLFGQ